MKKFSPQKLNEKGIALLLAMFCVMIMAFLAVEVSFDTSVEYVLSSKEYHRVKAYEAAQAGMELSLLRVQLFKNVNTTYGSQLKGQEGILQLIWSLPFSWPPAIPKDTSIVDKDQVNTAIDDSFMDAHYVAQITAEGSKIDVNDLDSLSPSLKKATHEQLIRIFQQKLDTRDDAWAEKNRNLNYEEIINNLEDWIDEDNISLNGGDESSRYQNNDSDLKLPPNRPFQTMDELKMVDGMTEDIFQFLLPYITVYGSKGINVNQAGAEILKSIDPIITDDVVKEIIKRRSDMEKGGPFKDQKEFMDFIGANEQTFNPSKIPLLFGSEYNFRIRVIGEYHNVTREIIAIVYDVEAVRDQMITILDQDQVSQGGETPKPPPTGTTPPAGNQAKTPDTSKEKPRIVYWWEN